MDWISKLREGDNKALESIYRRHRTNVCSWLSKTYGMSTVESHEIFQHSVVQLYLNVKQGKQTAFTGKLENYLTGISKNLTREYIRNKEKHRKIDYTLLLTLQDQEDLLLKEDKIIRMERGLNALGEKCRELLKLFYYENKSIREIQSLLSYGSEDSVKSQKYKCLKRLQSIVINTTSE